MQSSPSWQVPDVLDIKSHWRDWESKDEVLGETVIWGSVTLISSAQLSSWKPVLKMFFFLWGRNKGSARGWKKPRPQMEIQVAHISVVAIGSLRLITLMDQLFYDCSELQGLWNSPQIPSNHHIMVWTHTVMWLHFRPLVTSSPLPTVAVSHRHESTICNLFISYFFFFFASFWPETWFFFKKKGCFNNCKICLTTAMKKDGEKNGSGHVGASTYIHNDLQVDDPIVVLSQGLPVFATVSAAFCITLASTLIWE